jgi:hypothetical protein
MMALQSRVAHGSAAAHIRVAIRSILAVLTLTIGALLTAAPAANAQVVTAVEYRNAAVNHYFVTVLPNEIAALDGGAFGGVWQRTGYTFDVWAGPGSGRSAVCRFFAPMYDSHFYGRPEECVLLQTAPMYTSIWESEGVVFYLQIPTAANPDCGPAATTLYRLFNDGQGDAPNHRYTTSLAVVAAMKAQGWVPEGVGDPAISACLPLQTLVEPKSANGVWTGTTSLNETATFIVETDGTFYGTLVNPGASTESAIIYGKADVDGGRFDASATSIPVATKDETHEFPSAVAVSGTFTPHETLQITLSGTSGARTLDAAYQAGSDAPPSVAALAGSYAGFSGHAGGRQEGGIILQPDGTFAGSNPACSFAGTLVPRSDLYAFDYTIRSTIGTCIFGDRAVAGIAYQAPGSKRLLGAAQFLGSPDLYYLLMTKP